MKKRRRGLRNILIGLLIALILVLGAGFVWISLPGLSFSSIDAAGNFRASLFPVLSLEPTDGYSVQQGAATDGEHAYFILENQKESLCSIWKVDMDGWKIVGSAFELPLDHGNDMTYNSSIDRLVVAHNKPHYSWVSLINPDTLELEKTIPTSFGMFSIAYCPERDQYAIGLAGTYHYAVLDSDFGYVAKYNGIDTGMVKQGMDCDENYIYFPQSSHDNSENIVMVYDWEGNFITRIPLSKNSMEVETLFHDGNDWYAAFHGSRSRTFRMKLRSVS